MSDADEMARRLREATPHEAALLAHRAADMIEAQAARIGKLERERDEETQSADKWMAQVLAGLGKRAKMEAVAFELAANQCLIRGGIVGDDGGTPYCTMEARATAAEAERDRMRAALADLVSWFDGGPSSYGPWIFRAGDRGADDAVNAARATLAPTDQPSGNPGRLPGEENADG